jgi:hypothetical protein
MPDGVSHRSNAFVIFDGLPNSIIIARLYQRRPIDLEIGIEQSDVGISTDTLLLPGAINENNNPFHLSVSQMDLPTPPVLCPPIFVWIEH